MLVDNLNLKPAAEAPPPRGPVDPAEPRRPAAERASRESLHAKPEAETREGPSSRSRLAYDDELSRVFVEIVDRDSGEVVSRFPPEQLVRHIDSLIDRQLVPDTQKATGLLVDQSV